MLAGDSLHALAFEILADPATHADPLVRSDLVLELARAAGPAGMAGGQMMDLVAEGQELDLPAITRLQQLKTGALIEYAVEAACIMAGCRAEARTPYRGYARNIGLAFQIADDLIDHSGDEAAAGKRTGKDASAGKATFVSLLGDERARAAGATAGRPGDRASRATTARKPICCAPSRASRSSGTIDGRACVGVYPGTFDPITLGHLDIIRRGAHLVDRLVIGVTTNPSKEPMFTVAERLAMVRREVADIPGDIEVVEFDSLLMDFAESAGRAMILRGLRAVADFEYEYPDGGHEPAAERRDRDRLPDGRRVAAADRVEAGQGNRALRRRDRQVRDRRRSRRTSAAT